MTELSVAKKLTFAVILLIAFVDGLLVADHFYSKSTQTVAKEPIVITEDPLTPKTTETNPETTTPEAPIASIKSVPFTTQAPLGMWESPWTDYAEEACLYMAYKWANNEQIATERQAADDLFGIGTWERDNFGSSKLTDASQTLRILKEYLHHTKASLSYDVSLEDMKTLLDQDMLIIVPVNGALLGNPHYGDPAPQNHMILIYDYAGTDFITNDPGTTYGEAYSYNEDTLLNAVEDVNGDKVMIVIGQ